MTGIGGVATAAQLATANPPLGLPSSIDWLTTAPNPWVLVTALFSALGAASSVATFLQPAGYTAKQARSDRRHIDENFRVLDEREGKRHDALMEAFNRDKHEQALADIISGTASPELLDSYERALAARRPDGGRPSPEEAAQVALIAQEASQSDDPRQREIADLIEAGKLLEASDLKAALADQQSREAMRPIAREMREAGWLALPLSPSRALEHFQRATELDPTDVWSWIELGRLRMDYGTLAEARACFQAALQHVADERDRSVLHNEFGDVLMTEGELTEARQEFQSALAIAERLAEREPGNSEWQRDLSVSHNRLGGIEVAAGNLDAARARFEASLAIRERLAAREPGNSQWQRDLSVSHNRLGGIEVAAGNLDAARARFETDLDIAERLAAREPGNSEWQRDLWASHGKLGQLAEAAGNPARALAEYRAGEAVMAALVAKWPGHPGFARDLEAVRGDIARLEG